MASILVLGEAGLIVELGTPDDDGDYRWRCRTCGERGDAYRPLDESAADAEVHVDIRCEERA